MALTFFYHADGKIVLLLWTQNITEKTETNIDLWTIFKMLIDRIHQFFLEAIYSNIYVAIA